MNKKTSTILTLSIFILTIFNSFLVMGLQITDDTKNESDISSSYYSSQKLFTESLLYNGVPQWKKGNMWKYYMKFYAEYKDIITIDGKIDNFKMEVIKVDEVKREYTLRLSGHIDANMWIFQIIPLGFFSADLSSESIGIIDMDTLGLKKMDVLVAGTFNYIMIAGGRLTVTFDPVFDYFDFPIEISEDWDNPWSAETDGTAEGYFSFVNPSSPNNPFTFPYTINHGLKGEKLWLTGMGIVEVPAGRYDSVILSGKIGPQYSGKSHLTYSDAAGFFVKIDEEAYGYGGRPGEPGSMDAKLYMELKETNYISPNNKPNKPSNPSPANGARNVDIDTILSWSGGDPDKGDTVLYDVYLGKDPNIDIDDIVSEFQIGTSYNPTTLEEGVTYYWKVDAGDNHYAFAVGDIWEFTTAIDATNKPPYKPSNPRPINHATDVFIISNLEWSGGDPNPGDIVKYDVYLSESSNLGEDHLISKKQTGTSCFTGLLKYDKKYYWKVVAYDDYGLSTESDIWDFITTLQQPPNQPPCKPSITGPTKITKFKESVYDIVSTDPDGDIIYYLVKIYYDGRLVTGNSGCGYSGTTIKFHFTPVGDGNYEIKVNATDGKSGWSGYGTISITCPKNVNPIFNQIILRLTNRLPMLQRFFQFRMIK